MRRALSLQCCLALVIAFFLAPFQHVHRDEVSAGHHTHAPLIHAHFHAHHHDHIDKPGEREIESPDEAQFFGPNSVQGEILDSNFGQVIQAQPPRLVQIALRYTF